MITERKMLLHRHKRVRSTEGDTQVVLLDWDNVDAEAEREGKALNKLNQLRPNMLENHAREKLLRDLQKRLEREITNAG